MPDATDRFLQGGTPGVYHEPGLPNITGKWRMDFGRPTSTAEGAFYNLGGGAELRGQTGSSNCGLGLDASRSNSIYGSSETVQPKSLELVFCIRY